MRVEDNLALVRHILKRHGYGSLEYEDAFQEGCVGLCQAARTYDANQGSSWSSWAYRRILGAILDAAIANSHSQRKNVPEYTLISFDEWRDKSMMHDIAEPMEEQPIIYPVKEALATLPPRDQLLLHLLYEEDLALIPAGKRLGVSESRACQLKLRAIRRLASRLR